MNVGDWVQAVVEITEENFNGQALWRHAHVGAIGHVQEVLTEEIVNVYFEAAGTVTLCDVDHLRFLHASLDQILPRARAFKS